MNEPILEAFLNTPVERRESGLESLLRHLSFRERVYVQKLLLGLSDPFSRLPLEILLGVFDFLHPLDVWSQRLVCQRWQSTLCSTKFELAALARLDGYDAADEAQKPSLNTPVEARIRHIQGLRLSLPFTFLETKEQFAFREPRSTLRKCALEGHRFAYLQGAAHGGNRLVVYNFWDGSTYSLFGHAREMIYGLALSQKLVAFVTYQGLLYISRFLIVDTPLSRIRLPSSAIVSLAADEGTVAVLLLGTPHPMYTVVVCDIATLKTKSFIFEADFPSAAGEDMRGKKRVFLPQTLLLRSSEQTIDIFSSARVKHIASKLDSSPHGSFQAVTRLLVNHRRFTFDGEQVSRSDLPDEFGGLQGWSTLQDAERSHWPPWFLGNVRPTGKKDEYCVDFCSTMLSDASDKVWSLMFDVKSAKLYQDHHLLRPAICQDYDSTPVFWKDRIYRISSSLGIDVFQLSEPREGQRPVARSKVGHKCWSDRCYKVLMMNDYFMVKIFPEMECLQVLCFQEGVKAPGFLKTGFWTENDGRDLVSLESRDKSLYSKYSKFAKERGIGLWYEKLLEFEARKSGNECKLQAGGDDELLRIRDRIISD